MASHLALAMLYSKAMKAMQPSKINPATLILNVENETGGGTTFTITLYCFEFVGS